MAQCAVCDEELYADQDWLLRPDIEAGKLESEYDEDYQKPYCHEECHSFWSLLERLAEKEHDQWMHWSKYVADNHDIPDSLREKWEENWRPYSDLSDELKEKDRKWARKALEEFRNNSDKGDNH